ncbi:MAG TPA: glycosyltransferase family 39 protein [Verrucomicrobiae bacterium]|nr:glycosyltransferase family 39 protein [Verrucomicrobiae bacterium]
MQTASDRAAAAWLKPEFARRLAILWVAGLALVYLIRYEAWLLPFQLFGLFKASLPTFYIGQHFHEFWAARIRDFLCVGAILAAAMASGAAVVSGLIKCHDLFAVLFALAAGFWVLAVFVLILGAVSVRLVPYAFLAILCWLLPAPRKLVGDFFFSKEKIDGWAKFMIVCVVAAAALNFAGALTPPFEYDTLEYHLGALADYQRAGHIVFLPHNFYSNLPQLTEMLYLLAMSVTSDIAAKLLHWIFGVLGAFATYSVARRLWSRNVALTAAALFYCTPFVQDLSQTARVDLATAFFATLALGALIVWSEQPSEENWIWLSALCVGGAVATKWTAIPVVLFSAMVFAAVVGKSFRLPAIICLTCFVFVVPWLVKNWLLAGNPVYPLFYGWFPHPHWSAARAAVFAARHAPTFEWQTIGKFFAFPWDFSFTEPGAVPLLLMTAPLLVLVRHLEQPAKRAGKLFVGAYVGWFCFTFRPWRFLFPSFGLAAATGAYALYKMAREPAVQRTARVSVGIVLALSLAVLAVNDLVDAGNPEQVPPQMNFVQYALGHFSRSEFLARIGGNVLEPIIWMNEHLPENAKVVYIGEARVYYARNPVLWSTAFDQHPLAVLSREATTGEGLLALLRSRGVTDIYMNRSELARLQRGYHYMAGANWSAIDDLLQHHAREIHASGSRRVYELTE